MYYTDEELERMRGGAGGAPFELGHGGSPLDAPMVNTGHGGAAADDGYALDGVSYAPPGTGGAPVSYGDGATGATASPYAAELAVIAGRSVPVPPGAPVLPPPLASPVAAPSRAVAPRPVAPPPTPRAVGYAPAVPDYAAYLPAAETPGPIDALRSGIEVDRLQGRITDPQARARRAGIEGFRRSPVGLAAEQSWLGQESAGRRYGIERELAGELTASEDELDEARTQLAYERDRLARQAEAEHAASRKAIDGRMAKVDQLNSELASTKVDPQRFWRTQHPVQSIMSVLGVALGGLAEGISGGKIKSRALEMLNSQIDRDIHAQMADLETRKGAIAGERSAIGIARERLADRDAEFAFMRGNLLEQTADVVAQQSHLMKDAERRAALRGVAEDLRAQANEQALALKGSAIAYGEMARQGVASASAGARPKRANADMQARYVKALGGFAADAKTAAQLNAAQATKSTIQKNIAAMKLLRGGAMWNPFSDDRAKYDVLRTQTMLALKEGESLGTWDKGSAELLGSYVPDAPYAIDTGESARLDELGKVVDNKITDQARNAVVIPGTMRTVEDGKGGYETVYEIDPNAQPQGRAVTLNPVGAR